MERRREKRLAVELPGTYRVGEDAACSMFFSQLSSKGCRLAGEDLGLKLGEAVELFLGPIGPIQSVVRWSGTDMAGVEFHVALDSAVVGYFAAFINDVA